MRRWPPFTVLFATLAVLPLAPAQTTSPTLATAGEAAAPLQVCIVGASVSAGFVDGPLTGGDPGNRTVPLQQVVRGWLRERDGQVQSRADLSMFLRPVDSGTRQIEQAIAQQPGLVLAVDFLFWFGYGYMRGEDDEQQARLARLEQGLALLDRLECPVVVGDFPDMQGAARRMISPQQIPDDAALAALNARLRAWAAERPRMQVFPLAELVATMKTEGVELPLEAGAFEAPAGSLLQGDRLHANRLGMAWLGYLLQTAAGEALPEAARAGLPRWTLDQFVELCRADLELEDLMQRR